MKENMIKFNGYMIKKFLLEKNNNIPKEKIQDLELSYNIFSNDTKENLYKISLNVVTYTNRSKLDLTLEGFFDISEELDEESKEQFLYITAPTIIYPYARSFISNVTSFDIDDTVILPVINFANSDVYLEEKDL